MLLLINVLTFFSTRSQIAVQMQTTKTEPVSSFFYGACGNTASNLLGHSVLIPGNVARPDENGEFHGVFDLPEASSATSIVYTDAQTGELLLNHELGPVQAGLVGFNWNDVPQNVIDGKKLVKIDIQANTGSGVQNFGPSVYARVLSASAGGSASDGLMLDVEDYGDVNVNNVLRFR